ncbi:uncharacterized protein [Hetaerina americana]|uniref:uncharacterized protein n=1 Tax=Hetaerina americana TaxID=62018 RepID=UPI003A7F6067
MSSQITPPNPFNYECKDYRNNASSLYHRRKYKSYQPACTVTQYLGITDVDKQSVTVTSSGRHLFNEIVSSVYDFNITSLATVSYSSNNHPVTPESTVKTDQKFRPPPFSSCPNTSSCHANSYTRQYQDSSRSSVTTTSTSSIVRPARFQQAPSKISTVDTQSSEEYFTSESRPPLCTVTLPEVTARYKTPRTRQEVNTNNSNLTSPLPSTPEPSRSIITLPPQPGGQSVPFMSTSIPSVSYENTYHVATSEVRLTNLGILDRINGKTPLSSASIAICSGGKNFLGETAMPQPSNDASFIEDLSPETNTVSTNLFTPKTPDSDLTRTDPLSTSEKYNVIFENITPVASPTADCCTSYSSGVIVDLVSSPSSSQRTKHFSGKRKSKRSTMCNRKTITASPSGENSLPTKQDMKHFGFKNHHQFEAQHIQSGIVSESRKTKTVASHSRPKNRRAKARKKSNAAFSGSSKPSNETYNVTEQLSLLNSNSCAISPSTTDLDGPILHSSKAKVPSSENISAENTLQFSDSFIFMESSFPNSPQLLCVDPKSHNPTKQPEELYHSNSASVSLAKSLDGKLSSSTQHQTVEVPTEASYPQGRYSSNASLYPPFLSPQSTSPQSTSPILHTPEQDSPPVTVSESAALSSVSPHPQALQYFGPPCLPFLSPIHSPEKWWNTDNDSWLTAANLSPLDCVSNETTLHSEAAIQTPSISPDLSTPHPNNSSVPQYSASESSPPPLNSSSSANICSSPFLRHAQACQDRSFYSPRKSAPLISPYPAKRRKLAVFPNGSLRSASIPNDVPVRYHIEVSSGDSLNSSPCPTNFAFNENQLEFFSSIQIDSCAEYSGSNPN